MQQITLALIKPHVVSHKVFFEKLTQLIREGNFRVLHSKKIRIPAAQLERFYAEHHGKFFYNRLITFMSSGPCQAFILESQDCIRKWRSLMGPTKVYKAVYSHPECARARFGLSDTRNACHGSDSEESALREISIIFPELKLTDLNLKLANNKQ